MRSGTSCRLRSYNPKSARKFTHYARYAGYLYLWYMLLEPLEDVDIPWWYINRSGAIVRLLYRVPKRSIMGDDWTRIHVIEIDDIYRDYRRIEEG